MNFPGGGNDPFLWLEDIHGEPATAWVDQENRLTDQAFRGAAYEADVATALTILNAQDKIPFVGRVGDHLYNLWQDESHKRGLWRRTTLDSYRTDQPDWDVLIDLDALGAAEARPWAFGGAVLSPDRTRALVRLSPDGSDAAETREFDLGIRRFVEGGFLIPESKGQASWQDADTLLVSAAIGAANITRAGYGRTVRRWRRGDPLETAETIFSVEEQDVAAWFYVQHRPGHQYVSFTRMIDFTRTETFIERRGQARMRLDLPEEISLSIYARRLLVQPKRDWAVDGAIIPAGALAAFDLAQFIDGSRAFDIVFAPTPTRALQQWVETRHGVVLDILDQVRSRVALARPEGGTWVETPMAGLADNAAISIAPLGGEDDPDLGTDIILTTMAFDRPPTLSLWTGAGAPAVLKQAPHRFDAKGIEVRQQHATAQDGTQIPYFLVGRDLGSTTPRPTLLSGYGGFEIAVTPAYPSLAGKLWLERGHLLAVANIRGGGEFGARWHQAARRATKHVSHDDFASVARHLAETGVTTPARLAARGGSNGGLLVGNMLTRYPELFGAIWCEVPLLDMARYTRLLAGQSWIAEYGDPDDLAEWAFIRDFSPYHLVREDRSYPPTLITTNRTDDRVHPGHARKMVARLKQAGAPVRLRETVAGGHSGAVDSATIAATTALGFSFLRHTIAAERTG
ncbi:prolyl oligopeptidase family serine peptidase [Phreatobacter stygius]|nr:prolyl oligopeptidase family serine peptidase [Phreatobacter stygius]